MASNPRLVNKQFNSPIGLYSQENIREVIQRESQVLANGAVGINFNNPNVGKPANLQNSAVLRMLEEEEQRQRNGQPPSNGFAPRSIRDEIKWPPPEYENKSIYKTSFKDVVTPGLKRVAWPPNEGEEFLEQVPVQAQGGPQYTPQSVLQNNHAPAQHHRYPLQPLDISSTGTSSPYQSSSFSPLTNQSPAGFKSPTPSKQWAPVHSPVSTPGQPQFKPQQQYQPSPQQYQPSPQQYQHPPQQYQHPPQQYQHPPQQYQHPPQQYQSAPQNYQHPPQQYQQSYSNQYQQSPQQNQFQNQSLPSQPQTSQLPGKPVTTHNQVPTQQYQSHSSPAVKKVEPPPSTITLRPQAPVSQAPPPVVTSQPATATLRGGKHLRGDLKWPPEHVKKQFEEEKRALLELEKGPAFRPLAVRKDYTPFFAQHALNSSYPGYKVPPGTQFYDAVN